MPLIKSLQNKINFRRIFLGLLAVFFLLFFFRLLYGYQNYPNRDAIRETLSSTVSFLSSNAPLKKNYASKSHPKSVARAAPAVVQVDQKYEKIASVKSQSKSFSDDESRVRKNIQSHEAIIQFEQKQGNEGHQQLLLQIGVPPEKFDALYAELIQIGDVVEKSISKKDKTNEFKELNAKRISLEKTRSSLTNLKNKGGNIKEFISLENRILELEDELQALGVSLGDFDDENEFCTVKFSLREAKLIEKSIGVLHRIKVALLWSIKIYTRLLWMLFLIVAITSIFLTIINKLRVIEKIVLRDSRH